MAAAATSHADVKVKFIDTQYVETDPLSFKSVVQRLTGKECSVSWIEESSFSGLKTQKKVAGKVAANLSRGTTATVVGGAYAGGGAAAASPVSTLTKVLSFEDLDRMILDAPPVDDLKWLWAD